MGTPSFSVSAADPSPLEPALPRWAALMGTCSRASCAVSLSVDPPRGPPGGLQPMWCGHPRQPWVPSFARSAPFPFSGLWNRAASLPKCSRACRRCVCGCRAKFPRWFSHDMETEWILLWVRPGEGIVRGGATAPVPALPPTTPRGFSGPWAEHSGGAVGGRAHRQDAGDARPPGLRGASPGESPGGEGPWGGWLP